MSQIADSVHERRIGPRLGQVGVAYDKENLGHEEASSVISEMDELDVGWSV
jgi:hypothetical protein